MRAWALVLAIIIIIGIVGPGHAPAQDEELILRVALQDDVRTLNPLNARDVWTNNVLRWIYEGPMLIDPVHRDRLRQPIHRTCQR